MRRCGSCEPGGFHAVSGCGQSVAAVDHLDRVGVTVCSSSIAIRDVGLMLQTRPMKNRMPGIAVATRWPSCSCPVRVALGQVTLVHAGSA